MKKRIFSAILAAAMVLGLLTACGTYKDTGGGEQQDPAQQNTPQQDASADTEPAAVREKTKEGYGSVTFVSTEPNTLNPMTSTSNLDADVFYLISAMLYRPYGDEVLPEIAESYERSEDGKTYTYKLREANYADGTPITAADFVYYIVHATNAQNNITKSLVNGAAFISGECDASEVGAYAPDDHTLVVELAEASAEFVPEMTVYPVNQAYAESKGDALGGKPEDFLCSGPYLLTDWTYGASLSFEKNPDYWDAENSFQIASLKLLHGVDENARYNMFTTGEADIIIGGGDTLEERLPEYATHYRTGAMHALEFNTTGFYFDGTTFAQKDPETTALLANINFRKALCYALNREAIVSVVAPDCEGANRYFEFANGTTPGMSFAEEFPIDVPPVTGDAEQAKEYLAAAMEELGYKDVSELPTVKYLTFENAAFRLMAETIQSEWKTVLGLENIEIDMKPIQDAIMSMVYMNYDIYYQPTTVEPTNPLRIIGQWTTEGYMSDVMGAHTPFSAIHANPDFDALVAKARGEFDDAARGALVAEAEEMFLSSYLFIPIMNQGSYYFTSDRVDNFVHRGLPEGYMFNNATVVD